MADHETALLRYATRILRNATAAQDVVQNVFIKLFQGWAAGLEPNAYLKSWLYRVTHNEAVDLIRRESRRQQLHERQAEAPEAACADGVHGGSDDERRQAVLLHLGRLSAPEQQVVLLRMDQGLSYREIAEVMTCSEGYVGTLLHHAVRKLGTSLKKAGVVTS